MSLCLFIQSVRVCVYEENENRRRQQLEKYFHRDIIKENYKIKQKKKEKINYQQHMQNAAKESQSQRSRRNFYMIS